MSTSKIPPDSASADYLLTRGVKLETAEAEDGRCRPSDKPDYGEVLYFPLHGGEGYLGKYLPAIPGKKAIGPLLS